MTVTDYCTVSCEECMKDAPYEYCCKLECGEHEFCRRCQKSDCCSLIIPMNGIDKGRRAGMNIDARKQEILNNLYTLENECKILLDIIPKVIEELLKVKTEEDAAQFNENIDSLFEGINLIIE